MDADPLTFRPKVDTSITIVMDGVDVQAQVVSVKETSPGKGTAVCRTEAPVDVTVVWEAK